MDFLFVQSMATIIARALHIPVNPSVDYIAKVAEETKCPPFTPKKVAIQIDEKQTVQEIIDGERRE